MDPRIEQLRTHLRIEPGSRRFFQLGELLRKEGSLDEAATVLTDGLEIHPRYVAAWVSLGRAQAASEQWADAEGAFAHALQLDPENAVAARLIGEVAESCGETERALKAYQLARAMTPGDTTLVESIERVEAQIRGETTAPMVFDSAAGDLRASQPFAEAEPFAESPEPASLGVAPDDSPFVIDVPKRRRTLAAVDLPAADPFLVTPTGDTGVWVLGDDVFMSSDAADEDTGSLEDELESSAPGAEVDAPWVSAESEMPEAGAEPEPRPEPGPATSQVSPPAQVYLPGEHEEILPLQTVTLARLAIDQGDVELARETLEGLLAKDPADEEAQHMLLSLQDPPVAVEGADQVIAEPLTAKELLSAKASALKAWMEAMRLAADRRAP